MPNKSYAFCISSYEGGFNRFLLFLRQDSGDPLQAGRLPQTEVGLRHLCCVAPIAQGIPARCQEGHFQVWVILEILQCKLVSQCTPPFLQVVYTSIPPIRFWESLLRTVFAANCRGPADPGVQQVMWPDHEGIPIAWFCAKRGSGSRQAAAVATRTKST